MPKFKYTGDSGRTFPAVQVDSEILTGFTVDDGDIIEAQVNPDEGYFTAVSKGTPVDPDPVRFAATEPEATAETPAPDPEPAPVVAGAAPSS